MTEQTQGTVSYDVSAAIVLAGKAQKALAGATAFVIDSPTMYEIASDDLKRVKAMAKEVEEKRTAITGPINAALKEINKFFAPAKEYLETAEATLKGSLIAYDQEQRRKAEQAERQAQEAARRERERIEAEARETQRQADEEAARIAAEAAAAARAGDATRAEALQAEAERTAAAGAEQAQLFAMTAEMVTAAPVPVVTAAPKVAGLSTRKNWKARCVDKMALIRFVAEHPDYQHLLDVSQSAINQLAKAQKDAMMIDGVEAYPDEVMSARAA